MIIDSLSVLTKRMIDDTSYSFNLIENELIQHLDSNKNNDKQKSTSKISSKDSINYFHFDVESKFI